MRKNAKISALILAACFGAAYGVAAVLFEGSELIGLAVSVAVSVLMCYIAFGRPLLLATALFNGLGLLLGGAVTAAYMAINRLRSGYNINLEALPTRVPFGWTIIIAAFFGIAAMIAARIASKRRIAHEIAVEAQYGGSIITFNALTDSGNILREPLSGSAVIVTSYAIIEPILPSELRLLFRTGDTALIATLPFELMRRVRLIPAEGASGNELFIGFLPDRITAGKFDHAEAYLAVAVGGEPSRRFGGTEGVAPALFG